MASKEMCRKFSLFFQGHVNKKYRLESTLDCSDQLVLSGSENGFIHVWDMVEGTLVQKLDHGSKVKDESSSDLISSMASQSTSSLTVHSLSFHPEKAELVSAAGGKVYVWRGKSVTVEQMDDEDVD
jgi:mitogen-activated protein kinase organizer 1